MILSYFQTAFILSLYDIKVKYTRSVLGPFWNAFSILMISLTIGPLYGKVFGGYSDDYLLYLSSGLVAWWYISALFTEGATSFAENNAFLNQTNWHPVVYVLRVLFRNYLFFLHNLIVPLGIYLFLENFNYKILLLPVLYFLLLFVLFPIIYVLAFVSHRFRDVALFISTAIQFSMFLTPVFWVPTKDIIRENIEYLIYNPFYHFISILRSPFMDSGLDINSLVLFSFIFLFFGALAFYIHKRYSTSLIYWS